MNHKDNHLILYRYVFCQESMKYMYTLFNNHIHTLVVTLLGYQTRQRFFYLLLSNFGDPVRIEASASCS